METTIMERAGIVSRTPIITIIITNVAGSIGMSPKRRTLVTIIPITIWR